MLFYKHSRYAISATFYIHTYGPIHQDIGSYMQHAKCQPSHRYPSHHIPPHPPQTGLPSHPPKLRDALSLERGPLPSPGPAPGRAAASTDTNGCPSRPRRLPTTPAHTHNGRASEHGLPTTTEGQGGLMGQRPGSGTRGGLIVRGRISEGRGGVRGEGGSEGLGGGWGRKGGRNGRGGANEGQGPKGRRRG